MEQYIPPGSLDEMWDADGLSKALESDFGLNVDVARWLRDDDSLNAEGIAERCIGAAQEAYDRKVGDIGSDLMRGVEKQVMLRQLDHHWKDHLAGMDHLRQGIGLRSYAQKNPKQEYKREAFEMFGAMLEQVKHDTVSILSRIRIQNEQDMDELNARRREAGQMQYQHAAAPALGAAPQQAQRPAAATASPGVAPRPQVEQVVRDGRKVGRNEPCPCGSGKKFKQCHGRLN